MQERERNFQIVLQQEFGLWYPYCYTIERSRNMIILSFGSGAFDMYITLREYDIECFTRTALLSFLAIYSD